MPNQSLLGKMQAENPMFFYAIQCDENRRATNFFWVDFGCRVTDYYFEDVITFDIIYRINKYDMCLPSFTAFCYVI